MKAIDVDVHTDIKSNAHIFTDVFYGYILTSTKGNITKVAGHAGGLLDRT